MSNGVVLSKVLLAPRLAKGLVLGLIFLLGLAVLWYIHAANLDTISRDEWRFVDILRHWYEGNFSLQDIWSTNTAGSEHRVPAFKLYFLANALWFGLDVRIGCYLGALALTLFAWLLYRYFLRTRPSGKPNTFDHYAFVPVAFTVFSFTQAHIYTYDLLAMFTIVGSMLFGALWMQMDVALRTPQPWWRHALFAVLLLLLLLSFGAGKNPALAVASLVLGIGLALQAASGRWRALAWIAAGTLLAELIYFGGGAGSLNRSSVTAQIRDVLDDPSGAFHYLLHALGAAFITVTSLSLLPPAARPGALDLYGGIVLAGSVAALAVYLWSRGYRRALLPLVLAVFAAAYLGELIVARFGGGTDNGSAPRYVYTDHLLVVACVFVFADALTILYRSGKQRAAIGLLVALTLGIGQVEVHNQRTEFRAIGSQAKALASAIDAARTRLSGQPADYPRWYCPDQQLCDDGTKFLAEHHLNFMRAPETNK
ncbi:MAG TPA: hypothetical protein VLV87_06880 [Gammaproteobacteria bacterium]|nr:hypothetical protein [Gammaproteobacteria bacterium]